MPLSEREQRLLADLERQLHEDDPRLATRLSAPRSAVGVRRLVGGLLLGAAGLAVVLVGVSLHQLVVGVLGMALLAAGLLLAFTRPRGAASSAAPASRSAATGRRESFMARLERDWDERRRSQP